MKIGDEVRIVDATKNDSQYIGKVGTLINIFELIDAYRVELKNGKKRWVLDVEPADKEQLFQQKMKDYV